MLQTQDHNICKSKHGKHISDTETSKQIKTSQDLNDLYNKS
jgi:hypothetical protein